MTRTVTDSLGNIRFIDACELHGIADCSTCHRADGQCDYGACQDPATKRVEFVSVRSGLVLDVRHVCAKHKATIADDRSGGPRTWAQVTGIEVSS